jgi:hypothetical protein
MNFKEAIHLIVTRLEAKQPLCLNPAWIARHCPAVYRFISKTVRTEIGGIDWDRVTSALPRRYQR